MIGMKIMRAHLTMAVFGMLLMIPDLKLIAEVPSTLLRRTAVQRFAA